ncbi:MAG TPA: carbamate kinase [Bacteroidales bacterium]|nr:carbamate kinase [Bacteroidales bacterium]
MNKLAVVAFGGNALLRGEQKGTIHEQEHNARETCKNLLELVKNDYNIVITHGNGPQVGNILLQNIAGSRLFGIPEMPLDICGAYSQGFIGYIIEQQFRNLLEEHNLVKDVITIITQVLVDKDDPAFKNPTKPVGPFYSKAEADAMAAEGNSVFAEDPRGRGWRKVVASPVPLQIGNRNTIENIARNGQIVIAVGGGGIPVYYKHPNFLEGIDAVIDKDLASSLLALQIHADEFYILTDVPKVCINFNKPDQKKLDVISVEEAKRYLAEGHFTEGSMAPKIRAAINFTENGKGEAIITESSKLSDKNCGTKIVKSK